MGGEQASAVVMSKKVSFEHPLLSRMDRDLSVKEEEVPQMPDWDSLKGDEIYTNLHPYCRDIEYISRWWWRYFEKGSRVYHNVVDIIFKSMYVHGHISSPLKEFNRSSNREPYMNQKLEFQKLGHEGLNYLRHIVKTQFAKVGVSTVNAGEITSSDLGQKSVGSENGKVTGKRKLAYDERKKFDALFPENSKKVEEGLPILLKPETALKPALKQPSMSSLLETGKPSDKENLTETEDLYFSSDRVDKIYHTLSSHSSELDEIFKHINRLEDGLKRPYLSAERKVEMKQACEQLWRKYLMDINNSLTK